METNVTPQSGPSLAAGNFAGSRVVFFLLSNAMSTLTVYALHSPSFSQLQPTAASCKPVTAIPTTRPSAHQAPGWANILPCPEMLPREERGPFR
jgi:hypothetical protein